IRGGEIELLNIGDSRILVEGADGQVRSFGDSALHELDRQSLAHFCRMRLELQQLHRRLKTTSLYVTHDQVEAMTLAQRVMVMNKGVAEQIGTPV
ncbi:protein phosphatase 2C domain-containing protein, partial [Pseudomonas aeruginosa]|nr:protein phosphatase 2C domain-containing protein [Pseudomonas aeruginosa]